MSIVALKRRTNATNNVSTGGSFSLTGTLRNQGYVGQTGDSRSITYTRIKSNVPGEISGAFAANVVKPYFNCLNDSTVVKTGAMSQQAYINTRFQCLLAGSETVVKPGSTQNENVQSAYTSYKAKKALADYVKTLDPTCVTPVAASTCANYNHQMSTNMCNIVTNEEDLSAYKQSDFVKILTKTCIDADSFDIPTTINNVPLV